VRNQVRRRLREICRLRLVAQLPAHHQVVIRALPGAADASYAELESELIGLAKRMQRTGASKSVPVPAVGAMHDGGRATDEVGK